MISMTDRLYTQLMTEAWPKKGLSPINKLILIMVVLSIAIVILETEKSISDNYLDIFFVINAFFAISFTIEYLLRLLVIGKNSKYKGFYGRLRFIITPFSIIDLVAFLPFYFGGGSNTYLLRILRLLRILKLAKIGPISDALNTLGKAIKSRSYELIVSICVALFILFVSAVGMYLIEGKIQPDYFGSIPRSLWWAVITLTTVGYGDVYPITAIGKVCAGISAFAGIGIIAMPTGILAAAFSNTFEKDRK